MDCRRDSSPIQRTVSIGLSDDSADDLTGGERQSSCSNRATTILPFATDDVQHRGLRSGTASQNPVLRRSILVPLEQAPDSDAAAMAAEICDWVLENIYLPGDVKRQLRDARSQRKT